MFCKNRITLIGFLGKDAERIPLAHTKMWKNQHAPGNMAVLVNAPRTGLRTFDDVLEASRR